MRPLRYSINVTLDGCCDHTAIIADEELHRHAAGIIARADALLFGRVVYTMMEEAWPTIDAKNPLDLELVGRVEFASGAVAMQYVRRAQAGAGAHA
jgi:hypothetical protein